MGSESPMNLCGRSHVGDHVTASRRCAVRHIGSHVTPRMPCGLQGRRFQSPCAGGGPGLRSRDAREAPQPIRSSACGALQGAPLQQPLGEAPEAPLWVRGTPVGLRGICGLGVTCGPGGAFVGLGGHLWVMGILFGTAGHLWVRVVTCGSAGHLWAKVVTCGLGRHFWVRKSLVVLPPPVTRRPPRPFGGPAPLDAAMPPPNHKGTASVGHPHPQILGVCPCASARSP